MTTAILTTLLLGSPTLEIRVEGDGYLRLGRGAKTVYATRVNLTSVNGALGTTDGDILLPRLMLPPAARGLKIDLEGNINMGAANLGRLVLGVFPEGTKLTATGAVFTTTIKPTLANPGEGAVGIIRVGGKSTAPLTLPPTTPISGPVAKPANAATEGGKATVTIRMRSEIETDHFTIGDIAVIDGEPSLSQRISAIAMGPSPMLGTDRGIALPHLIGRIRLVGIDTKQVSITVPTGATLGRKAQQVAADQILDAARGVVKSKLGIDIPLIAQKPPAGMNVTPGEVSISAETGVPSPAGIPVTVTVRVAGKLAGTRSFTLLPEGGNAGVRAGETVKIHMICNGATIELEGRASSAGWVGQNVNVTTTPGEKGRPATLTGTVKAPGIVEVKA